MNSQSVIVLLLAYLFGSIPFGFLLVKLKSGSDIRAVGSGGTGATNVSRKAGKAAGILTLALDALKGFVAVWLARWLGGGEWIIAGAAVLAVVGHCFPVWLKFKAGKGVATGLGVFLAIVPWAVLASFVVFALIVWQTRYVSLGSICAAASIPLWAWLQHQFWQPIPDFVPVLAALCAVALLIIAKHGENIQRLLAGKESKFGAAR
jgi:glycerol-3-phosphate acyltransferase PlsY